MLKELSIINSVLYNLLAELLIFIYCKCKKIVGPVFLTKQLIAKYIYV
jgi:hypothetical protein